MAKAEKKTDITISGGLRFDSVDPLVARFTLEDNSLLIYGGQMNIPAEEIQKLAGKDFDPNFCEVTGTYEFKISVKDNRK